MKVKIVECTLRVMVPAQTETGEDFNPKKIFDWVDQEIADMIPEITVTYGWSGEKVVRECEVKDPAPRPVLDASDDVWEQYGEYEGKRNEEANAELWKEEKA